MVKIADFMPQKREFQSVEDTWALIAPASYSVETRRSAMIGKGRTVNVSRDRISTGIEANLAALFSLEIWLTYVDTNLEVELPEKIGEDGEVATWNKITFGPRKEETQRSFMEKIEQLPLYIVYDWHNQVTNVVPEWRVPF